MRVHRIVVRPSRSGRFVWNFVAANGRVTANNETHPTRANAVRAAKANVRAVARMLGVSPSWFEFTTRRNGQETEIFVESSDNA